LRRGAIGFTREHALHHLTQRLWAWQADFGNDRHWSTHLGQLVARHGAANLWPGITA
jgi:acyl-CoA dehydrogenase